MSTVLFPPVDQQALQQCKKRTWSLNTTTGKVKLTVSYGWDKTAKRWCCPTREQWGLGPHAKMSPMLEDRICYTATESGSYERAAKLATKWGSPVDGATIHAHVQKTGAQAQKQENQRVAQQLQPQDKLATKNQGKSEKSADKAKPGQGLERDQCSDSIVLEFDGWMVRQRGPDWGRKRAKRSQKKLSRVEWHEMKSATIFRLSQRAQTQSGRRILSQKFVVAYQGDPVEFGRRVQAEALRRGMGKAKKVYVVADGALWIWNLKADRFEYATGLLDFYHASEHLWAVARELYPDDEQQARKWVEPLLRQLKEGKEKRVLNRLDALEQWFAKREKSLTESVVKEVNYFHEHQDHLHYQQAREEGCPIGSGSVESLANQFQHRFKRSGQFWRVEGLANLMALEVAKRNEDWDDIWLNE